MSWGIYGILFAFAAFILLLIFNPRLSCFGKRITSPFYPLFRRKKQQAIKTEDYGFKLGEEEDVQVKKSETQQVPKTNKKGQDYGFHLD